MPVSPREIELKLLIDPKAAAGLDLDRLACLDAASPATSHKLESIYFDTSDERLRRRSIALRVRRVGRHHIQTMKVGAAAGPLAVRGEWETEVDGPRPDLSRIDDPKALETIGLLLPEMLEETFRTRFTRQARVLSRDDAVIEVALDRGSIDAGGRQQPIAEIELELKKGATGAVFELVEALRPAVPCRIGMAAKAERGHRLRNDLVIPALKPAKLELDRHVVLADGIVTILRDCLTHWLVNHDAAVDGRDSEGVHQLRIGIRRLRSAIAVLRHWLARDAALAFGDRLRQALRVLGTARQLDVLVEELLPPVVSAPGAEPGPLDELLAAAAEARGEAYAELRGKLEGRVFADLALDLLAWIELGGWRAGLDAARTAALSRPMLDAVAPVLTRRRKKLLKLARNFPSLSAAERHEVRIALKKLRYAVEFLAPLYSSARVRRYLKHLTKLQGLLGEANDMAECRLLVDMLLSRPQDAGTRADVALGGGMLIGWYMQRAAGHREKTDEAFEAFSAATPFWREG